METRLGSGSPEFFGLVDGRLGDEVRHRQTENICGSRHVSKHMLPHTLCFNVVSACWSGMVEKNMVLESSGDHGQDQEPEESVEAVETEEKIKGDSYPLSRVCPCQGEEQQHDLLLMGTLKMTLLCMHDLPKLFAKQ